MPDDQISDSTSSKVSATDAHSLQLGSSLRVVITDLMSRFARCCRRRVGGLYR